MRDLAVQCAGVLAILCALTHGVLAESRVFPNSTIEPASTRRLVRLVWQASTVDWIGGGLLLLAVPYLASESARLWIIGVAVMIYGFAAAANAVATRGRHFGWMIMLAVVVLALLGI